MRNASCSPDGSREARYFCKVQVNGLTLFKHVPAQKPTNSTQKVSRCENRHTRASPKFEDIGARTKRCARKGLKQKLILCRETRGKLSSTRARAWSQHATASISWASSRDGFHSKLQICKSANAHIWPRSELAKVNANATHGGRLGKALAAVDRTA
eukprot:2550800-Pleurochrysis_carterae.AAC.2